MNNTIKLKFVDLGWPVICPIISKITGHWSNHVEIYIDEKTLISALPGGVRKYKENEIKNVKEEILEISCTKEQKDIVNSFIISQLNKPYDYLGVLLFSLAPSWNDSRRWFCSELIGAALIKAKIIPTSLSYRISPGSLYNMCKSVTNNNG